MKFKTKTIITLLLTLFISQLAFAATHFVSDKGSAVYPYTSKAFAANSIQDAVDAATNGAIVIVAAGIYSNEYRVTPGFTLLNRLVIDKNITVQSEEGPGKTVIMGAGPNGDDAVRCVFMTNNAVLIGFTLSNGHTLTTGSTLAEIFYNKCGGGLFMVGDCYVSNCVFTSNSAGHSGGGVFCYSGGTVDASYINNNTAGAGGGITFYLGQSLLKNSFIMDNNAAFAGGGVNIDGADDMKNCFISGNSANIGAGVYLKSFQTVSACTISNNFARNLGGGVYIEQSGGHNHLTSCLIVDNIATNYGGGIYQFQFGYCSNCTIARNYAGVSGGGVYNKYGGNVNNSIIYYNNAPTGSNYEHFFGIPAYNYCCTTPWTNNVGINMITNNPEFVDMDANNFRLYEWSACINTGLNAFVDWDETDLDGNPRIYDGTVDLGCYELVPEPSFYFLFFISNLFFINYWRKLRS